MKHTITNIDTLSLTKGDIITLPVMKRDRLSRFVAWITRKPIATMNVRFTITDKTSNTVLINPIVVEGE